MNYCSNCGKKVKFGDIPGEDRPRFYCAACGMIHYENPNMIVGCLPRWQDQVLLCKRAIEPRKDFWTLPAGFLENRERVEDGAVRETVEEANAEVEVVRLFAVYSLPHVGQIYLLFLAELQNLNFYAGAETAEVGLFKKEQIPWDTLAFRAIRFTLECYFDDEAHTQNGVYLGGHER